MQLHWSVSARRAFAVNVVAYVVFFAVSFGIALCAALDLSLFRNLVFVYVIGAAIVAGLHGLAGQLAVSMWVECYRPMWTRLSAWHHLAMGAAAAVLVEVLVVLDGFGVRHARLGLAAAYVFWSVAVLGAFLIGGFTYESLRRRDANSTALQPVLESTTDERETPLPVLSGLVGLTSGALVFVTILIVASYDRQHSLPADKLAVPAVPAVTGRYVALGDSYSSGEGLPPFTLNTDTVGDGGNNGCHRSQTQAYSELLAQSNPQLTLAPADFVACSGAVADDVTKAWHKTGVDEDVRAQDDGTVHPDVNLVTLTIGGNDINFSSIVEVCFEYDNCLDHKAKSLGFPNAPDRTHPDTAYPTDPSLTLENWLRADAGIVGGRLDALFAQLRHDYPKARIVAIGYPYLFPASGTTATQLSDCNVVLHRYSGNTRDRVRSLMTAFTDLEYERAVAHGVDFVSPLTVWDKHEPCGTLGQFTNSLKPFLTTQVTKLADSGSFHPTADGQKQLAALVGCYLDAYPGATAPSLWSSATHGNTSAAPFGTSPSSLGLSPPPGSPGATNTFVGCGSPKPVAP
jgi:lysophospholipase L1-like esterase